MSKTSRIVFLVLLASILGACESTGPRHSTAVNRVLMAPQISTAPFSNVLIVGAAPTRETARNIEEGLTQELSRRNIESHSFVRESDAKEPSEEAIMALVDDKNIDAVLVVSAMLEGAELTSRSLPGPGGSPNYELKILAEVPESLDARELREALETEGDRLVIDVALLPDTP